MEDRLQDECQVKIIILFRDGDNRRLDYILNKGREIILRFYRSKHKISNLPKVFCTVIVGQIF